MTTRGATCSTSIRISPVDHAARAKTIVFLPGPLIEPPIMAFEDDRIAEGIVFMQGLVRFAEREGDVLTYPIESSSTLNLLRVK